eukprot:6472477-Amphidinium_carterae.2
MQANSATSFHKDQPPVWDGNEPELYWRAKKREIRLWQEDTDVTRERQGIRLFRALQGKAKQLADVLPDTSIKGPLGVESIIHFFDQQYQSHLRLQQEKEFEELFYTGTRASDETFDAFVLRREAETARYEQYAQGALPTHTKGKLLLRQSRLTQAQMSRVLTWLEGFRDHVSVSEALAKLDTEMEMQTMAGGDHTSKSMWQYPEDQDFLQFAQTEVDGEWSTDWWYDEDDEELVVLYGESNDVGYASDGENEVWIHPWDLENEFEAESLQMNLASFAAVQKAKMDKKRQRGFPSWSGAGGKSRGLTTFAPSGFGKGKHKGKGKGKSKDKDKGKYKGGDRMSMLRDQRDERRRQGGMTKVKVNKLHQRVRCWRCGQLGHMAASCTLQQQQQQHYAAQSSSMTSVSDQAIPSRSQPQRNAAKTFFVDFQSVDNGSLAHGCSGEFGHNFLLLPGNLSVVDTGAVNGLCGIQQFLSLDAVLKSHGLGACQTDAPTNLGGIGGAARVVAAAMVPISLSHMCGILSLAICEGEIPLLLPNPLLQATGAVIDCMQDTIQWSGSEQQPCYSKLQRLQSGHIAVSIVDYLDSFLSVVPEADRFIRGTTQQKFADNMLQALRNSRTSAFVEAPLCYSLEDEQDAAATAAQQSASVQDDTGRLAMTSADSFKHVIDDVGCDSIYEDYEFLCPMDEYHPSSHVHYQDENLWILGHLQSDDVMVKAENMLLEENCAVAAQAQTSSSTRLASRHGTVAESHSEIASSMEEPNHECCERFNQRRFPDDRDGIERSDSWMEKNVVEGSDSCPYRSAAGSVDGIAGCMDASEDHAHIIGEPSSEISGHSSGSAGKDKTVRFQDCVEVHRCEHLCSRGAQAEGESSCEMVELLELSCTLAKGRRRADSGGLAEDIEFNGRLLLDPQDSDEDEQLTIDDEAWSTLWVDTEQLIRIQCGKLPEELMNQLHVQSGEYTGRYLCAGHADSFDRHPILSEELPVEAWTGVLLPERTDVSWCDDLLIHICDGTDQLWNELQCAVYGWHELGDRVYVHLHPPRWRVAVDIAPQYDAPPFKTDIQLMVNEHANVVLQTESYCWLSMGKRARHRKLNNRINLMSLYSFEREVPVVQHLLDSTLTSMWTGQAAELLGWPTSCVRSVRVEGQSFYEIMKADGESFSYGFGTPLSPHVHRVRNESKEVWSSSLEPLSVDFDKEPIDALHAVILWARLNQSMHDVPDLSDMSFNDLCDLLEEQLKESTIPVCSQRTNLNSSTPGERVRSIALGAYTTRGLGCTQATWRWFSTLQTIHALARHRSTQECYLSVSVNNGAVSWHVDRNESSRSWLLCVGNYVGGELQTSKGTISAFRQWIYFDASEPHRVLPVSGQRWSVSLYTPHHAIKLPSKTWRQLTRAGFPVKAEQCLQFPELPTVPELEELAEEDELSRAEPVPLDEAPRMTTKEAVEEIPTTQQKAVIRKIHVNLGHPPLTELLRALRLAKVRVGLRLWVKNKFYCEECHLNKKPSLRRPSMLPRSYTFNRVIGIDCLEIKTGSLSGEHYVNMVCWGTRLQVVTRIGVSLSAEAVLHKFLQTWVMVYGWPEQIICDQGSEFKGKFRDFVEWNGTLIHCTDSRSPHQNGRTERAGGLVKEQVQLVHDELDLLTHDELEWAVCHAVAARNAYVDRSGFSAHQRVFGSTLRFPRDMLGDDHLSADQLAVSTKSDHIRSQDIRAAALASLFRLEAKSRLARAARAKTRTNKLLPAGAWVFLLRRTAVGRSWREGPGLIIATAGTSAWISLHGEILKVAQEMLREATSEELRGIEEINHVLPEMKEEVELARRQRRYRDLTREVDNERRHMDTDSTQAPSSSSNVHDGNDMSRTQSDTQEPSGPSRRHSITSVEGGEQSTPRSVRRRLEPGVAEAVRRLEGQDEQIAPDIEPEPVVMEEPVSADVHMSALQNLLIIKKKTGDGVVESNTLSPDEWAQFLPAVQQEVDSMIKINKGLRPLSLSESLDIYNNKPHRVVKSRMMLRWKPVETEHTIIRKPKARWIILGHQDPDALELEGRAPSPTLQAVNIFLCIAASRNWEVRQGDLAEAFYREGHARESCM